MKSYIVITFFIASFLSSSYCLYPRDSRFRETKILDGLWLFKICDQNNQDEGFKNMWYNSSLKDTGDVIPMPVPSSFNDVTQNKTIRDYLGWSWYQRNFFVPQRWNHDFRILLHFGSAHYYTIVYLNGHYVMNHTGGHLPFEADVTSFINFSAENQLTVALNNTLSDKTIPQGSKTFKNNWPYPPGFYEQGTEFDFFNYAGIHRSVILYAIPKSYISDIDLDISIKNNNGYVGYKIYAHSFKFYNPPPPNCSITIYDKNGRKVAEQKPTYSQNFFLAQYFEGCVGTVIINNTQLWWPFGMHKNPGYMYKMHVLIKWDSGRDEYILPFGVRSVKLTNKQLLINNKPVYLMGFGKHEDSNIRGKGVDLPLIIKDFNLIKWIGANSFRTSHYPYADEIMDQADEQGILVIDECPAVGLKSFGDDLLQHHKEVLTELIKRDKNRPSVIAWSVANEPSSSQKEADKYFSSIVAHVKSLDLSRPVTAALNADYTIEEAGKHLDFVMLNHYFSWYEDTGYLEVIKPLLINYMSKAYEVYKKPIMMSEYGGDTIAGLHMDPPFVFTEDYQMELMLHHHEAFDVLQQKGFFIGEHIWNFADFMTIQQITRVVGNKKGIFTRERQPKASARVLRCRYHKLLNLTLEGSPAYCPVVGNINQKSCFTL